MKGHGNAIRRGLPLILALLFLPAAPVGAQIAFGLLFTADAHRYRAFDYATEDYGHELVPGGHLGAALRITSPDPTFRLRLNLLRGAYFVPRRRFSLPDESYVQRETRLADWTVQFTLAHDLTAAVYLFGGMVVHRTEHRDHLEHHLLLAGVVRDWTSEEDLGRTSAGGRGGLGFRINGWVCGEIAMNVSRDQADVQAGLVFLLSDAVYEP